MRVLVVEDEPDLLRVVAQALREAGYAVDEAANGADGLAKATSWDYDALILDLMLPQLNGLELLRRLRRRENARPHPHRATRSATGSAASTPGRTIIS